MSRSSMMQDTPRAPCHDAPTPHWGWVPPTPAPAEPHLQPELEDVLGEEVREHPQH